MRCRTLARDTPADGRPYMTDYRDGVITTYPARDDTDLSVYPDLDLGIYESCYLRFKGADQPPLVAQSVLITDSTDKTRTCAVCRSPLSIVLPEDDDETEGHRYEQCKMFGSRPCHFPVCWEQRRVDCIAAMACEATHVFTDEDKYCHDVKCAVCNLPFTMFYHSGADEYAYSNSKVILDKLVHHPKCWEIAREGVMKMLEDDQHSGLQSFEMTKHEHEACALCSKPLKAIHDFSTNEWVYANCTLVGDKMLHDRCKSEARAHTISALRGGYPVDLEH